MTAAGAARPRTVTFGDLETSVWGTMLAGETPFLALGAGDESAVIDRFTITGEEAGASWWISGEGIELELTPDGDALCFADSDQFVQLCRIKGGLTVGGERLELECAGLRGTASPEGPEDYESLRAVSAWFERDEGVSLLARRPRKAAGHAGDAIVAAVIDADGGEEVADARLSTTYAEGGLPTRMSLELWVGAEESEQYSRRVAGEATGALATATVGGLEIVAAPLRCHSRGRDGTGMYLLARRR